MKKIILVGIVVVVTIMGVLFFRGRLNMNMFSRSSQGGADLIIVNNSSDEISSSYKKDGKEVDKVLKAGQEVTGGKGFIRLYTAKKSGSYELTYAYPRPAGAAIKVALSQIIQAAQQKNDGDELYTEKGMIGDIKVEYEEVRQLDPTY